MAEEDLTLQLKLVKDQARQQLAEFGSEAQAQIATDLSQVQAAERAKAAAAKAANAERAQGPGQQCCGRARDSPVASAGGRSGGPPGGAAEAARVQCIG